MVAQPHPESWVFNLNLFRKFLLKIFSNRCQLALCLLSVCYITLVEIPASACRQYSKTSRVTENIIIHSGIKIPLCGHYVFPQTARYAALPPLLLRDFAGFP